jgi:RHS repeat-associated protein
MLPVGSTAQFYAEDFLGSTRVVTTNTGVVCYNADFTPFGGERTITNTCTQNAYKFEGKERDAETQNDDFGALYYSWRFGRWLSADWLALTYEGLAPRRKGPPFPLPSPTPISPIPRPSRQPLWEIGVTPGLTSCLCCSCTSFFLFP